MSKIGKQPILIPKNVQVKIEGDTIEVKGPKGTLARKIAAGIGVEIKEDKILLTPQSSGKKIFALWGTMRALIANMVKGVVEGFERKLEIEGIGFRAVVEGNNLNLSLGFSHPVKLPLPQGVKTEVSKNIITVSGCDKELVGRTAALIRAQKKVEPYKGKGIKYVGEKVRRKLGKRAVAA